jgi:TM2 domain-containing membrane protein YozV
MSNFCPNCGTSIEISSAFCLNCGVPIEKKINLEKKEVANSNSFGIPATTQVYHSASAVEIRVSNFLIANSRYFDSYRLPEIKNALLRIDESKWINLEQISYKDPTLYVVISLSGGTIGLDRFFLGDNGLGFLKLITCGGCGLWTIIDWFMISDAAKEKNYITLRNAIF